MKSLILHHPPVVPQQIHTYFQMLSSVDILGHDRVIRSVKEYLPQKLDRLPFSHIRGRADKEVVVALEEEIEVDAQVLRYYLLVLREDILAP